MTENVQTLLEKAVEHHQSGDLLAAEPLYKKIMEIQPEHWDALYLLGTAQLQQGRFSDCIESFERVVAARPDIPDVHNNLGVAYQAQAQWELAAKAFQQAIQVNPEYAQAFFNLGALMEGRKLYTDAEKCFRHALDLNPTDVKTHMSLANVLKAQERWKDAEKEYRSAAEKWDNPDLPVNLAYVLAKQERLDEAAEIYLTILATRPRFHEIHNSLSYLYERQGKLVEAVESACQSLEIEPQYAEAYNNLGTGLRSQHRLNEACEAFENALKIRPGFPLAAFNLGTTKLLAGDYPAGWPGYAKHAESSDIGARKFLQPLWSGQTITGKTLLLHADQGFGDTIQFVRFLPRLRERIDGKIIFECSPELIKLFEKQLDVDQLVDDQGELPEFDLQVPLANLPGLLEIDINSVSTADSYLECRKRLRPPLKQRLDEAGAKSFKVGLIWQGNPKQARDIVRSCPFRSLMPLFEIDGISWFSLQTGELRYEDLVKSAPKHRPIDVGSELQDFADTAAVMKKLDLILTVDTATAHLAGALGLPVWTMLCHTPDWRWHLERGDSPWYPTMRLFRQPQWGDWESVIAEIAEGLMQQIG